MRGKVIFTFLVGSLCVLIPLSGRTSPDSNTSANTASFSENRMLGDALVHGRLKSWDALERTQEQIAMAERLVRHFSLKEEFSRDGRLIARERLDGTREDIRYDKKRNRISVWVTSPDGKFEEERFYVNNYLRAILYVDGSLKTFQYLSALALDSAPENREDTVPALCVVASSKNQVRILQYNRFGQLIGGFLKDGTPIMQQSQSYGADLHHIIHIDELQFSIR